MTDLSGQINRTPWPSGIVIWILVTGRLLRTEGQIIAGCLECIFVFGINKHIVMTIADDGPHVRGSPFLPNDRCDEILAQEYLIQQDLDVCLFVIVNADPQAAIPTQQLVKDFHAWPDEVQPCTMFQIVIILRERRSRIVRDICIHALHLPAVLRQQCPEGQQIVPVDQHISCPRLTVGLLFVVQQQARLYLLHGFVFSHPRQFQFRYRQENPSCSFYIRYYTIESQRPLSWLDICCI